MSKQTARKHANNTALPPSGGALTRDKAELSREQVEQRAYELYELRGRQDGFAHEDCSKPSKRFSLHANN